MNNVEISHHELDVEALASIYSILASGNLFYSKTYDLTHSLQHKYLLARGANANTNIDDRYFFNLNLAAPLLEVPAAVPWVSKLIFGYAGDIQLDSKFISQNNNITRTYSVVLISRINQRRLGTRYNRRGIDLSGNTANNVEMEQIVFNYDFLQHKNISSFVQMRGSVPSIWNQEMSMKCNLL
jgi:hypothetical protein